MRRRPILRRAAALAASSALAAGSALAAMLLAAMLLAAAVARAQDVPPPGGQAGQGIAPREADHITVVSEPPGAEIWLRDSLLGRAPLALPPGSRDTLLAFYPGRDAWRARRALLAPPFISAREGVVLAHFPNAAELLEPDTGSGRSPAARRMVDRASAPSLPRLSILLPAAAGIGAGIAAAALKQKADRLYEEYLATADPALLDRTRRYDIAAGVALAVLEAGVAYFAWLLFMQE